MYTSVQARHGPNETRDRAKKTNEEKFFKRKEINGNANKEIAKRVPECLIKT